MCVAHGVRPRVVTLSGLTDVGTLERRAGSYGCVPAPTFEASTRLRDRLGSGPGPDHPSLLKTCTDEMLAPALSGSTANLKSLVTVLRIAHPLLIVGEIRDGFLDILPLRHAVRATGNDSLHVSVP